MSRRGSIPLRKPLSAAEVVVVVSVWISLMVPSWAIIRLVLVDVDLGTEVSILSSLVSSMDMEEDALSATTVFSTQVEASTLQWIMAP